MPECRRELDHPIGNAARIMLVGQHSDSASCRWGSLVGALLVVGGLAEDAFVSDAAGDALLVEVFQEGEDVFAAGAEEVAGVGYGGAAVLG